MTMDLKKMQAEVVACTKDHGWYETDRSWGDEIALLHSEVSEALEAFRDHGIRACITTQTGGVEYVENQEYGDFKPEGVGSEFADVLIRLLDTCERYGLTIKDYSPYRWIANFPTFGDACTHLHSGITYMGDQTTLLRREDRAQIIYNRLQIVCEYYSLDLEAEYTRKHAYNLTRPYRHGGRAL